MFASTLFTLFAFAADRFSPVLMDVASKGCVVFLLAAVTCLVLHKSSAAMRQLAWGVTLLAFLLLPILSVTVPKWQVLPSWLSPHYVTARARQPEPLPVPQPSLPGVTLPDVRDVSPRHSAAGPATHASDGMQSIAEPEQSMRNTRLKGLLGSSHFVFVVWAVGAGLMLLRIAFSRVILYQLASSAVAANDGPIGEAISSVRQQLGVRHNISAYVTSRRGTPMTWGLFRLSLLLPAGALTWDPRRLRTVLLHELAHLKHYDTVTHVIAQLIRAVYWFHPLVWIAGWRFNVEGERACDDLVLRSGVKASDYAEVLVSVLTQRLVPCTALALVKRSGLEGRMRAILSENSNRNSITAGVFILALVVGVAAATSVAVLQAQPSSEPARPASDAVSVVCLDPDGQPVAGAEIYLFQHSGSPEGRYLHFGPLTSDDQGRASCGQAMFTNERGNFDRWIYARVPGRLVGVARCGKRTNKEAFNAEGRVEMQPSCSVEGRVTVPPGFDPTTVTVRVKAMDVFTGSGVWDYQSFPREDDFPGLDTALPEIFDVRCSVVFCRRMGHRPWA